MFFLTEHLPLKNGILTLGCLFSKSHLIEIIKADYTLLSMILCEEEEKRNKDLFNADKCKET